MNYSVATEHYVLSIDTDYCFVIISKGNTWRRSQEPALVAALSHVIPKMVPGDETIAAQLYADLSPLTDHEHRPAPVRNPSLVSTYFPPMGGVHSTPSRLEPVGRPKSYHPRHLHAASLECKAYKSINYYVQ